MEGRPAPNVEVLLTTPTSHGRLHLQVESSALGRSTRDAHFQGGEQAARAQTLIMSYFLLENHATLGSAPLLSVRGSVIWECQVFILPFRHQIVTFQCSQNGLKPLVMRLCQSVMLMDSRH